MSRFRPQYRELNDWEKQTVGSVKSHAEVLLADIESAGTLGGDARCLAIATTKLEEAVMWAVKGVTG